MRKGEYFMNNILSMSSVFILIICLGYFMKQIGFLNQEDSNVLGKIIVNITLPCVFFSSANGLSLDFSTLFFIGISFVVNFVMIIVGYICTCHKNPLIKGTFIISCSGYDVGNFVLPFVSAFLPQIGVLYLCSFNVANIIMSMGLTYAITCMIVNYESHMTLRQFFKELLSSVSLDVYLIILVIACFHITIPTFILNITTTIGVANSFLVMLMIGLKLEFHISKEQLKQILEILSIRLLGAIILSVIVILFLPLDMLGKKVLIVTFFGPMVSVSSIYAKRLGYEGSIVANATTLSILLSIILMAFILFVF